MEALLTVLGLGKLVNKTFDVTKSKLTKSKLTKSKLTKSRNYCITFESMALNYVNKIHVNSFGKTAKTLQ